MTKLAEVARAIDDAKPKLGETFYQARARAAVEAMREPTDAMRQAGYDARVGSVTRIWQAMIDAVGAAWSEAL